MNREPQFYARRPIKAISGGALIKEKAMKGSSVSSQAMRHLSWVLAVAAAVACNSPTQSTSPLSLTTGSYSGLNGSYSLTLVASPSCATVTDGVSHQVMAFPEYVRTRRYDAEFSGISGMLTATDGTGNQVPLGGIDHYAYYGQHLLWIQNNVLTIIVPPGSDRLEPVGTPEGPDATCAGGDYWWEILNGTEIFEACGTWKASVADPTRIAGTIDGAFGYYNTKGTSLPQESTNLFCRATDHQFILTPRASTRWRGRSTASTTTTQSVGSSRCRVAAANGSLPYRTVIFRLTECVPLSCANPMMLFGLDATPRPSTFHRPRLHEPTVRVRRGP
jgi:hypothetical protein